jgi:predicted secreted Zn-dependent protease
MPRTRVSAALYLFLVFASGILVGVVAHRLYVTATVTATAPPLPRTMEEIRRRYLADMRKHVGVSDEQVAKVNVILDDTKRRFDDLHRSEKPLRDKIQQEQIDQISALLTPQQKTAYDSWRAERARLQAEEKKKQQQKK